MFLVWNGIFGRRWTAKWQTSSGANQSTSAPAVRGCLSPRQRTSRGREAQGEILCALVISCFRVHVLGVTCWPSSSRKPLRIELNKRLSSRRREKAWVTRQMYTFCFEFMLLISQRLHTEGYRAIRGQEGEDSTLVGRVGLCREGVSRITRVPSSSEPKTNIPTEPHVWNTHFFFFLRNSRLDTHPAAPGDHLTQATRVLGPEISHHRVSTSHGASIFYHLVRVTHNVSNDVSQGGRPLLAVGDNGSMAVSQRAAPGEVSLQLRTRRTASLDELASGGLTSSGVFFAAACWLRWCGLFAGGRCSCLDPHLQKGARVQ